VHCASPQAVASSNQRKMGSTLPFRDGLKSKTNGGKAMTEKKNRERVIAEIGDTKH
jgi:hypothetical protein